MTPDNFLNILKGNKQAMSGIGSGKVIDRFSITCNVLNIVAGHCMHGHDDLHL